MNLKSPKILLVDPPFSRLKGTGDFTETLPHLGLGYLGAVLQEAGYAPSLYNANSDPNERLKIFETTENVFTGLDSYRDALGGEDHPVWDEARKVFSAVKPDIIGVTVMTPIVGAARKISKIIKEILPESIVVWGGFHPTYLHREVLVYPEVDIVVRGEGEYVFLELVEAFSKGKMDEIKNIRGISYKYNNEVVSNPDRTLIADLDKLPVPIWNIMPTGTAVIIASRGCPHSCRYCADKVIWRSTLRQRSIENIMAEINYFIKKHGVRSFGFFDGTFNTSQKRVMEICDAIIDSKTDIIWTCQFRAGDYDELMYKKMRKAGCSQAYIGVESGSDRMLEKSKKGTTLKMIRKSVRMFRKNSIVCSAFILFGCPDETMEEMEETLKFIESLESDMIWINSFIPLPGCDYYEKLLADGAISSEIDWEKTAYRSTDQLYCQNVDPNHYKKILAGAMALADKRNGKYFGLFKVVLLNLPFYLRNPKVFLRKSKYFFGILGRKYISKIKYVLAKNTN